MRGYINFLSPSLEVRIYAELQIMRKIYLHNNKLNKKYRAHDISFIRSKGETGVIDNFYILFMCSMGIIIIEVDFWVSEFSEHTTKTKNKRNQHTSSGFRLF